MKRTEHYHLPQWEPEDRILRTEFNESNQSVDAALKAQADALQAETSAREAADTAHHQAITALETRVKARHLFTRTLEKDALLWEAPITGIDWSQYKVVHILIRPKVKNNGSYVLYLNYNHLYQLTSSSKRSLFHLVLFPSQHPEFPICGLCFGGDKLDLQGSDSFQSLSEVTLVSYRSDQENTLLAGSSVEVYGE